MSFFGSFLSFLSFSLPHHFRFYSIVKTLAKVGNLSATGFPVAVIYRARKSIDPANVLQWLTLLRGWPGVRLSLLYQICIGSWAAERESVTDCALSSFSTSFLALRCV